MSHHHHHTANPLREIIIGAAAGAGAAFVMDQFQTLWSKYGDKLGLPGGARQEGMVSAPEEAAEMAVESVTGERLPSDKLESAGKAVHYATGAVVGAAYGVIASSVRGSTLGGGLPLGAASYLLLDQGLVPQMKLGSAGQEGDDQKIYALVSHLVFGVATDSFRRMLGAR